MVILFEALAHLLLRDYRIPALRVIDIAMFALVTPVVTWLALSAVDRAERERAQAAARMDLHAGLSRCLGEVKSWDELVSCIVCFPRRVAPDVSARLYVYHPGDEQPRLEAACSPDGQAQLYPREEGSLPVNTPGSDGAGSTAARGAGSQSLPVEYYDLPINHNNEKIGFLRLEYPAGRGPAPDAENALNAAAPLIALALEGMLLQDLAARQAAASEAERQQIAQDLHDTLAQNIGYLRLKLDQLTGENAIREIGVVLQELERMRATADEAYMQVRRTLDELVLAHSEDLGASITRQAQLICDRAGLALRTSQVGEPFPLPGAARQHIVHIAREALHNVEKHACASQISLQFLWLETELIMKITDNGRGFDPREVPLEGHYGLWIMQQRANELGGTVKIHPSDENGTEVTLWIPRPNKDRS